MATKPETEEKVVKMQKLRHAVARLRRVQKPAQHSPERRSWLQHLLERLKLSGDAEESQE